MRVFPVEPRSPVKVEVSYTHPLPFDSGVYEYTFPLKTGHRASRVLEDLTVTATISSKQPVKSVYSPSHRVGVTRKDDHHAIVGFEETGAVLDEDFHLFYTVNEQDFGLNLLTHRREGEDGYFALMIAPRVDIAGEEVMAKDVCFVIDTSGSMQEENRIGSARDAVEFCLKALNPDDRFALVTFSSAVNTYGEGLHEATSEAVRQALAHVEKLEARGGTDLCGAVLKALSLAPPGDRPYLIILATDGKPTVGVTEPKEIVARVEAANEANVRVFTFGIAENLNVPLLDRIAESMRGYSEYVAPGREIEAKISSFFRKVSHPVMSNLELDFGGAGVHDLYPPRLPDLFRGSQVVAFGRYSGSGDVAIRLSGAVEGEKKDFHYDASFPQLDPGDDFVPKLWARRKIGYLLDQIRLHGDSEELSDEVVRLSLEYGIATPYTSYLVLEDEEAYRRHGIIRGEALNRLRKEGFAMAPSTAPVSDRALAAAEELKVQRRVLQTPGAAGGTAEKARRGITLSRHLSEWKRADTEARHGAAQPTTVQRVKDRSFVRVGGAYVDTAFAAEMEALEIQWGSDAYFALLEARPELRDYLALGESVVVVVEGKAVIVADKGKTEMTVAEIEEFLGS
jgi:Ca-activated chloride channel family protein